MNAIVSFRLCKLTDEELLDKVDKLTDQMYQTGRMPVRHIGELIKRYHEKIQ